MTLDPTLLSILACPDDKGPLYYVDDEDRLYNPRLCRSYPIIDGIPVLLIDQATTVDAGEHERLQARIDNDPIEPTFTP